MNDVLLEICQLLKAELKDEKVAEAGTDDTTLIITNHGLKNDDLVFNQTRNEWATVLQIDANTLAINGAIANQVAGDIIVVPHYKKFIVGQIERPAMNDLPLLMVYGRSTQLEASSTIRDRVTYTIAIEIHIDNYSIIDADNGINADLILKSEQEIINRVERIESDRISSRSVIGALRQAIQGSAYLFNNNFSVEYENKNIDNRIRHRAIIELNLVSNNRLR